MTRPDQHLAVVVKGWPRLSESFIAQEILALERLGFGIDLYSLRQPTDKSVSAFHAQIKATTNYLPEYLARAPKRLWQSWRRARHMPGYRRAVHSFLNDLMRDPTANRLRRFGQALVMAAELPPETQQIHCHFLHTPCSVARYTAILSDRPYSFSAHAKDIWTLPVWEKKTKIAGARFGVTCTRQGLEELIRHADIDDRDKFSLVYHGVDPDRFPISEPATGAPMPPLRLLSIGRLVPKKGFDVLLEALATLPHTMRWRWTHFGAGPDAKKLENMAVKLAISEKIEWRGAVPQENLVEAYRSHHLFILPSRKAENRDQDGLPNVLLEAQSQGMACIASDLAGIPELIVSGKTGLLVPPDDPLALRDAIVNLGTDEIRRQHLGREACKRVRDHFLLPDHIGTLAAHLKSLCDGAGPPAQDIR